jgi:hypothetical protein
MPNEHDQIEEIFRRVRSIEDRMAVIETTVWGPDKTNGLRGSLRLHTEKMDASLARLNEKVDKLLRFVWIVGAVPSVAIAVVAILRFLGKV